jgi:hypothetical protein
MVETCVDSLGSLGKCRKDCFDLLVGHRAGFVRFELEMLEYGAVSSLEGFSLLPIYAIPSFFLGHGSSN